eukprot:13218771-Alexandrium_andersonii.AAC.1
MVLHAGTVQREARQAAAELVEAQVDREPCASVAEVSPICSGGCASGIYSEGERRSRPARLVRDLDTAARTRELSQELAWGRAQEQEAEAERQAWAREAAGREEECLWRPRPGATRAALADEPCA